LFVKRIEVGSGAHGVGWLTWRKRNRTKRPNIRL